MNPNPLLGANRLRLFVAAVSAAGPRSRPVDDGCPLTLYPDRTVVIAVSRPTKAMPRFRSQNPRTIVMCRVNVDTLAAVVELA